MSALIGQNSAGKSNILHALDFFFNPSKEKISKESFFTEDTSAEPTEAIEITVHFGALNEWENEYFKDYVDGDGLKVKRKVLWSNGEREIQHIGIGQSASQEWLREDEVTGEKIDSWWSSKDLLVVNGLSFVSYLPEQKPKVGEWKQAVTKFLSENQGKVPINEIERPNIKGYEGVLKGGLPYCVFVHGVSDVLDQLKVTKTGPFGQLITYVLNSIPQEKKSLLESSLDSFAKLLIKKGESDERFEGIKKLEQRMNDLLKPLANCALEIRPTIPSLDDVFGSVDMYANDGLNTTLTAKGHGLQRYVILTILRAYVDFRREGTEDRPKGRTMLLLIEEPELYLHPQAQRAFMQLLRTIATTQDQVLYSTHSNLFVDMKHFDEICLVRRKQHGRGFATEVTQLSVNAMIDDLKARHPATNPTHQSMRDRYSHAYNPTRNEGFFADKVVVVEGQSEEYALPIYADAIGFNFDRENISVVSAGGKGIIDRLYRVFNEFGIPCYLIFDGDKDHPKQEVKNQTRVLMRLMEQEDAVPEHTIVDGRFAVFANKWEDELASSVTNYPTLVTEAHQELGTDAGKPLISRHVARALVTKGQGENDPGKYVPQLIKEIIERIKQLQWAGTVLQSIISSS